MGDEELPEEAIHLAAGMLNAGYKSVVGTMWSIEDETAPMLMKKFYQVMQEQVDSLDAELQPAYALHEATRLLQKQDRFNFIQWVPYVHFGL